MIRTIHISTACAIQCLAEDLSSEVTRILATEDRDEAFADALRDLADQASLCMAEIFDELIQDEES